jgi:hypothetical protein
LEGCQSDEDKGGVQNVFAKNNGEVIYREISTASLLTPFLPPSEETRGLFL